MTDKLRNVIRHESLFFVQFEQKSYMIAVIGMNYDAESTRIY